MTDNELTLTYIDGLMRGREEAAEQLAAAQAREAQLRAFMCGFHDARLDAYIATIPTDETALKARLKAERERCAAYLESMLRPAAAELIRNLGDEP